MGVGASKGRVIPVAPISVQPAHSTGEDGDGDYNRAQTVGNSSLESSIRARAGTELNLSSDSKNTTPRAGGDLSRRTYSGRRIETGSRGYQRVVSGNRRMIHAGGLQSSHSTTGAKRFSWQAQGERGLTSAGLPFQRDLDLSSSGYSQRKRTFPVPVESPDTEHGDIVLLAVDTGHNEEKAATNCQLCGQNFNTLRMPLLLLCGHSYCGQCINRATEKYPSALRCGVCSILTPLGQQNADTLPQNESILDLVTSREFMAMVHEKNVEKCAECIHHPASVYCSECSASYCDTCAKKAHEGSRVRAKHKPVPINLKPRPQPTCRKHPGQSCVLYCETEKQPMCVLCKFYNQHHFHKFDLMTKVASKYTTSVTDKLSKLERMEQDLTSAAQSLAQAVDDVNSSARKSQEMLERHCSELQKSYCAALERRETVLLTLLDRQVELKQDMIEEARTEVAAARARILAAKEEAGHLLKLNPVTALLSRKHMDANFDRALKRTMLAIKLPTQPELPFSLVSDITSTINEALSTHGAILQLPPKPSFTNVSVTTNTISLKWECPQEHSSDVTADRTLNFSLHCHADIPLKMKSKISFKRQFIGSGNLITPESGFVDYSGSSTEPGSNFPSVPQSLLGSRNISLIALGKKENHNTAGVRSNDVDSILESLSHTDVATGPTKTDARKDGSCLPRIVPESSKPMADTKLPEMVKHGIRLQAKAALLPPSLLPSSASAARLNLPPLRQTHETLAESDQLSDSTTVSGTLADSEEPHNSLTPPPRKGTYRGAKNPSHNDNYTSDSTSSLSESTTDAQNPTFTNVGRFCRGFAFDEIYCGEESTFLYSGLLPGATYYFRVHCHNAAGWGPWSDTVKCTTVQVNK